MTMEQNTPLLSDDDIQDLAVRRSNEWADDVFFGDGWAEKNHGAICFADGFRAAARELTPKIEADRSSLLERIRELEEGKGHLSMEQAMEVFRDWLCTKGITRYELSDLRAHLTAAQGEITPLSST
jgi:hypothetical protein